MSKAKCFAVRKPSTGEIITMSPNQIVLPKFCRGTKMIYYIHQTPLSSWSVEGGLGTRLYMHMNQFQYILSSGEFSLVIQP